MNVYGTTYHTDLLTESVTKRLFYVGRESITGIVKRVLFTPKGTINDDEDGDYFILDI